MKKSIYSTILTTGLIAAMSTQAFAAATITDGVEDKNVTVGNTVTTLATVNTTATTTADATTPTFKFSEIVKVEPKSFTGIMPTEMYEAKYTDFSGNVTLVETFMTFNKSEYYSDSKIARPEPALTIGDTVYVSMEAKNPYSDDTRDYKLFNDIADQNSYYIANEITDYDVVNQMFTAMFGDAVDEDILDDFIFVQDLKTDKMTTLKFKMYAPINEDKAEYDLIGTLSLDLKGDVLVTAAIKQDVAVSPTITLTQKILMNPDDVIVNNGYLYMPVRAYANLSNYTVTYDPKTDNVSLKRGNTVYTTQYGSDVVTKDTNGTKETYTIDNPIYRVDGVGYIPVGFLVSDINN